MVDKVKPIILKGSAINQIMGRRKKKRMASGQQTTSNRNHSNTAIMNRMVEDL
jgi:hypothetical protein